MPALGLVRVRVQYSPKKYLSKLSAPLEKTALLALFPALGLSSSGEFAHVLEVENELDSINTSAVSISGVLVFQSQTQGLEIFTVPSGVHVGCYSLLSFLILPPWVHFARRHSHALLTSGRMRRMVIWFRHSISEIVSRTSLFANG